MTEEKATLEDENPHVIDPKEDVLLQLRGASYLTIVYNILYTSLNFTFTFRVVSLTSSNAKARMGWKASKFII